MNPIQALKQRRQQQQQEEAERKLRQLQEADERNAAARAAAAAQLGIDLRPVSAGSGIDGAGTDAEALDAAAACFDTTCRPGMQQLRCEDDGSVASDVLTQARLTGQSSVPSTPRSTFAVGKPPVVPGAQEEPSGPAAALTPLERRSSRSTMAPPAPMAVPTAVQRRGEESSAPPSLIDSRHGERPPSADGLKRSRSASNSACSQSPSAGSAAGSATERLRERMRQRESGAGAIPASNRPSPQQQSGSEAARPTAWQQRIEARQREDQEMQTQEKQEQQIVAERSGKRSDAMRRVMERQAQRQQDVMVLEA